MAQEIAGTRPLAARRPKRIGRWIGRSLLALLLVLVLVAIAGGLWLRSELHASLPQLDGERALSGLAAPVTVERDSLGVPTIRGANRLDVARATGFLHAQDRYFQMDLMRRRAAGELAELLGPALVESDRGNRVHRFRAEAGRIWAHMPPADRALMTAYTAGVNTGLNALGTPPFEYLALRGRPAPWRPEDSILVAFAMFFNLQGLDPVRESALGLMSDTLPGPLFELLAPRGSEWDAPLEGEPFTPAPIPGPEVVDLRGQPAAQALARSAAEGGPDGPPAEPAMEFAGSNNWALAGSHTASGRALLANDMHLGIRVPNTWYRASLVWPAADEPSGTSPGAAVKSSERRVTGVTLPGTPAVIVGSNGHVAWGFTNSYGDWSDLVIVEVDPQDPEVYRTPTGPRRFEHAKETIRVHGRPAEALDVVSTIWGPIVDHDHLGRPRALAWTAYDERAVDQGILGLEDARTIDQAVAVAHRSGVPAQNFVVADETGRIGWTIIGRVPRRVGFDGRLPSSWADGSRRWDGLLAPEEIPQLLDPPSGRLWTANARVLSGGDLARIGDGGYDEGARSRQIRDDLAHLEKATPADMLRIQLDDRALFLERWRGLLLSALDAKALAGHPGRAELRRLADQGWTGRASVDSVGYRIVRAYRAVLSEQITAPLIAPCKTADPKFEYGLIPHSEGALWRLVSERPPHLLDPRFKSWDEQLVAAADTVVERLQSFGPDLSKRTWGEANTTRFQHPLSQAVPALGRFLDVPPRQLPGDHNMPRAQTPFFGASERLAVSPGLEAEGYLHMPVGQSGHPLSPHYVDSNPAWAEGRPTPFLPGPAVATLKLVPAKVK